MPSLGFTEYPDPPSFKRRCKHNRKAGKARRAARRRNR